MASKPGFQPLTGPYRLPDDAVVAEHGQRLLVIDKDLRALLPLADHHTGLEKGRVVIAGSSSEVSAQQERLHTLIGV